MNEGGRKEGTSGNFGVGSPPSLLLNAFKYADPDWKRRRKLRTRFHRGHRPTLARRGYVLREIVNTLSPTRNKTLKEERTCKKPVTSGLHRGKTRQTDEAFPNKVVFS